MQIPDELKDFRNFLYLVWKYLNLKDPTQIQDDIADYLQHGPTRCIVEAFRGVGKSWECSAFVVHQLFLDPTKNILVVSASKTRADDFSTFTLRLIHEIPILQHLQPKANQRFSKIAFDVGLAPPSHAPSVKSLGITSQLTGSRADIIVADDIEVPNNSMTQGMRDKLDEQVKEFDAILKPLDDARIIFLGTPQCEDSIYLKLQKRGYTARVWPSEYVSPHNIAKVYGNTLAPIIEQDCSPDSAGLPTEPTRFNTEDLEARKLSYGRAGYELQYMLNPRLSDVDRYPLKINDLIVQNVDNEVAPERVVYAASPKNAWDDTLPNIGFNGDRYYRPEQTVGDMIKYTGSVMSIDPSGRGKDETGYSVIKMLNGFLYCPESGGIKGGYEPAVLQQLTSIAARNKVNLILIEANLGDGMFSELLKPYLRTSYPCAVEEVKHSTNKERRIIDTLEPVISQHRLIIDPTVIKLDYDTIQSYPVEQRASYSLFYQLSRITLNKGSILHDDRLDALSIAVNYFTQQMNQLPEQRMKQRRQHLLNQELKDFVRMYHKQPKGQRNSWINV